MPNFNYLVADPKTGHISRGRIDAENERHARQQLRNLGLLPLEVTPTKKLLATFSGRGISLSRSELGWVSLQLSTLLAAGLTLEASLSATIEQTASKHIGNLLSAIRADVRSGYRLCDAMATHPRAFPAVYCALIEAGESSGELPKVLEKLADYTQSRNQLHQTLATALIYPAIVTMVGLVMMVFLLTHVVPQIINALNINGQALPLPTRFLLLLQQMFEQHGVSLLVLATLTAIAIKTGLRNPDLRLWWDKKILQLPLIGSYLKGINTERFASTLGILCGSGVALLTSLETAARTITNSYMKAGALQTALLVREGSPLAKALKDQTAFEPVLIHLVQSGERTGELAPMLERAASTLSKDLSLKLSRLSAVLEPLVTLIMGALVLFLVLAIMLPIIEINQMVNQ